MAKSKMKFLYAWLNEKVRELAAQDEGEELDVEGLGKFLPDDLEMSSSPKEEDGSTRESEETIPKIVDRNNYSKKPTTSSVVKEGDDHLEEGGIDGDEGFGDGFPEQEGSNTGEKGKRRDVNNAGGDKPTSEDKQGDLSVSSITSTVIKSSRIFCVDPRHGTYRLVFNVKDKKDIFISLSIVGEVGRDHSIPKYAEFSETREKISVASSGFIGPIAADPEKKISLDVQSDQPLRCSMELNAYETK